ncbi:uncharacterized protein LY89DRAFT_775965 [Mollisia scopiformis]|uniref:Clr5 domain-containing protein n=1 Tax=Mollisia scopiformis TaxID=149040 RepID=A0A194XU18_MOLSC|nr:uncharacterized protein LY89DRAFT_775965 [Mollisia scopiformis]KUJ23703.1 hypothetical protein LY89DRAFT_775965 [Mollisia scopiformis]
MFPTAQPNQGVLFRNNLKWEALKDDIRQFYILEDHTLNDTMEFIQQTHQFQASKRKWKDKLKEWNFDKNIPLKEVGFMATKSEKRKSKIEQFKKRRLTSGGINTQLIPVTPPQVTYSTPRPPSLSPSPFIEDHRPPLEIDMPPVSSDDLNIGDLKLDTVEDVDQASIIDEEIDGLRISALNFMLHAIDALESIPYRSRVSANEREMIKVLDEKLHSLTGTREEMVDDHVKDDDGMDDGKSSNKYGVTYTDSGMTGVSLNYSDLWK